MYNIIPHIKTAVVLMVYGLLLASIATILIIISFPLVDEMTLAQVGLLIGELFLPVPIFLWARRTQMDLKQIGEKHLPEGKKIKYIPWGKEFSPENVPFP